MPLMIALAALQPALNIPRGPPNAPRAAQVASQPVAETLARFSDVPNVEVAYYDVAGHSVPDIHKAVQKAAARDPTTQQALPATSSWTVAVAVQSMTTGKVCRITGAALKFRGQAVMPRLQIDKETPAPVIAAWKLYVARLESRQAAQLRFAYDRMGEVERAILRSSCNKAEVAADAALARLQEEQLVAFKKGAESQPRLEEPKE